jgi:hypothetical protein
MASLLEQSKDGADRRIRRRVRERLEHLLRRRVPASMQDIHDLPLAPREIGHRANASFSAEGCAGFSAASLFKRSSDQLIN